MLSRCVRRTGRHSDRSDAMTAATHDHRHGTGGEDRARARSSSSRLRVLAPLLGEHRRLIAVALSRRQRCTRCSRSVRPGWAPTWSRSLRPAPRPVSSPGGSRCWRRSSCRSPLQRGRQRVRPRRRLPRPGRHTRQGVRGFRAAFPRLHARTPVSDLGSAAIADVEQIELFFAHTPSPLAVATTVPVATTVARGSFHWSLAAAWYRCCWCSPRCRPRLRRRAEAQGSELRESLGRIGADSADTSAACASW